MRQHLVPDLSWPCQLHSSFEQVSSLLACPLFPPVFLGLAVLSPQRVTSFSKRLTSDRPRKAFVPAEGVFSVGINWTAFLHWLCQANEGLASPSTQIRRSAENLPCAKMQKGGVADIRLSPGQACSNCLHSFRLIWVPSSGQNLTLAACFPLRTHHLGDFEDGAVRTQLGTLITHPMSLPRMPVPTVAKAQPRATKSTTPPSSRASGFDSTSARLRWNGRSMVPTRPSLGREFCRFRRSPQGKKTTCRSPLSKPADRFQMLGFLLVTQGSLKNKFCVFETCCFLNTKIKGHQHFQVATFRCFYCKDPCYSNLTGYSEELLCLKLAPRQLAAGLWTPCCAKRCC